MTALRPMPNPATDAIRRFAVVPIDGRDDRERAKGMRRFVVAFLVRDRCGFLPDEVFRVELPARGRRPGDDAIAAAKQRADGRRRDLNFCEAYGHHCDVVDELCATCGVRP